MPPADHETAPDALASRQGPSSGVEAPAPPLEYRMQIVAKDEDIDLLGHVSNLVYLRWVQEVAMAHSAAVGWDYEAYRVLGAVFVVRRHEIDYLRPAFAGETIELKTHVDKFTAATSIRRTEMTRTSDGECVARAETLWALISLAGRPIRIPPTLKQAFRST